jgi:N-acetylglucosamine-6-phosphate deacetylase
MTMSANDVAVIDARRLVDGAGHDGPGWLRIAGGVIQAAGAGAAAPTDAPDGADVVHVDTVLPGFVDTHVHGATGVDFATVGVDPTPAIDHHASRGSTRLVASLATGDWAGTRDRLRELAPLVRSGALAGLHLEGPFLSSARCGAHDPRLLRDASATLIEDALAAADGTLTMVTLAPELPGALDAIDRLIDAGVIVAIGHTDASADVVKHAVGRGATVITHLFNGMPPLHHRSPGPLGVALTTDALVLEVIADGHHVDDVALDLAFRVGRDRVSLVSDAMSATGLGDGSYELAGSTVVVTDGVAMLADGSSLAGSTTPLAGAVSRLLARSVPLADVQAASSSTPARTLRLADATLVAEAAADLVVLDGTVVARVMKAGRWLA